MVRDTEIIGGIIEREGDRLKNDPHDPQDPSKYGIGADTLGNWRGLMRRATLTEMAGLTEREAREIYRIRYVEQPGFTPETIPYEALRVQLIDLGVNSSPQRAIRYLQSFLRVPEDGVLGPQTQKALWDALDLDPRVGRWLNDAILARRLVLIDRTTDTRPGYKKYEEGLEDRAILFLAPAE